MIFAISKRWYKNTKKVKILNFGRLPVGQFIGFQKNFGFGLLLHISTTYLRSNKIRNVVWPPRGGVHVAPHFPYNIYMFWTDLASFDKFVLEGCAPPLRRYIFVSPGRMIKGSYLKICLRIDPRDFQQFRHQTCSKHKLSWGPLPSSPLAPVGARSGF